MSLDDLTDEDPDSNSSQDSSARRYVQPSREEFEAFLTNTGYEWEHEPEAPGVELVYDSQDMLPEETGKVLRVFSTIDPRSGKARSKGSDAIRLVVWDKNIEMPIGGKEKTLRIATWEKNLHKKIEELMENSRDYVVRCDDCNVFMVVRDGPYGEFYGCRNFPQCENKEPIDKDE